MPKGLNVFSGENSVKDFLDPDKNPPLPLVELPKNLNPLAERKVRIFAKLMNFLPLANVKSLPALGMIREKERDGSLSDIDFMVENSSGNTVFSLAVIGRIFGIQKTKAFVSHEVSAGKLQLLRFFGTEIMVNEEPICPDPRDKTSGIYKAKEMGKNKGCWNPGQYDNAANPSAHERWTGPQIWEQTEGKITVFCAGLGTTGTMVGTGAFLKRMNEKVFNLGVVREPNNPVPGVRTANLLQEIAFDWTSAVDKTVEIGTVESFERSLELCRNGIMTGPSSGFALAGLLDFLSKLSDEQLDRYRNKDGEVVAVFICPDSPFPYIQEYFEYLDADKFPEIENVNLLRQAMPEIRKSKVSSANKMSVSPTDAFHEIYGVPVDAAWKLVDSNGQIPLNDSVAVIDVRDEDDFNHVHLSQSIHVDYRELITGGENLAERLRGKTIYVICNKGNRSMTACTILANLELQTHSIEGGIIEWSSQDLPRWRPEACVAFQKGD